MTQSDSFALLDGTLPDGAAINAAAVHYMQGELSIIEPVGADLCTITAVGSVAAHLLSSAALRSRFADAGISASFAETATDIEQLVRRTDWDLALVLSPYKTLAARACELLTPAAEMSGVVDTMLRSHDGRLVGVNTNVFGAGFAIQLLMGGRAPRSCLVLGTGATARSCVVALRAFGADADIAVLGRTLAGVQRMVEEMGVRAASGGGAENPELVINATTVGERADATLELDTAGLWRAGRRFFDLNNRTSALQTDALGAGCVTLSGVLMQTAVNAARVHVARHMCSGGGTQT